MTLFDDDRCPYALHWGITQHTRCMLRRDHVKRRATEMHEGRGYKHLPNQVVKWFPADPSEYLTDRKNAHTWEEVSH